MLSGRVSSTSAAPGEATTSSVRKSLHEAAAAEALRAKWIESEKAGRDLGEAAIRAWIRGHWSRFVRERWIEHLEGRIFWAELDCGDFGLLEREFPDAELFDEIVRRVRAGG